MTQLLDEQTVEAGLARLDGWSREGEGIVRELRCGSFTEAIAFITRIAPLAEAADHHPELTNTYDRVGIRLTTHDAGGITQKDLDLAAAIDEVAPR